MQQDFWPVYMYASGIEEGVCVLVTGLTAYKAAGEYTFNS
jgi:hypothetical protein